MSDTEANFEVVQEKEKVDIEEDALRKYDKHPKYGATVAAMDRLVTAFINHERGEGGLRGKIRAKEAVIEELANLPNWNEDDIRVVRSIWADAIGSVRNFFGVENKDVQNKFGESWMNGVMGEVAARILLTKAGRLLGDSDQISMSRQSEDLDTKGIDAVKDLVLVDSRNNEKLKIYVQVKANGWLDPDEIGLIDLDNPSEGDKYYITHELKMEDGGKRIVTGADQDFRVSGKGYADRVPLLLVLGTKGGWKKLIKVVTSTDKHLEFADRLDDLLEERNQ